MADSVVSVQYLKDFVYSQINDDEKWAFNKEHLISHGIAALPLVSYWKLVVKLLRAMGLFAGSIVLMRNYGDLMAI